MRATKFISIFIALVMALMFVSCGLVAGPEKDVIVKIGARRIAFHGFKISPELFTALGETALAACEKTTGQAPSIEDAFQVIVQKITKRLGDPLLAQDIMDIVRILGVKFDAAFTLLGVTPEKLKYIQLFVCAFAQGVETARAL